MSITGIEKVIAHLELIQSNINRYGLYSFLVKIVSIVFLLSTEVLFYYFWASIQPIGLHLIVMSTVQILIIVGFWVIDAYYLRQERLFRHHYDAIRQQSDTDLNMYISIHNNKPKSSWKSTIFSLTLVIFYAIEIVFVLFLPAIGLYDIIY